MASAAIAEPLGESADRQVAISSRTATVAVELDAAIAEFKENGLGGGDDVRTLSAVRDVLGKLSADQMQRVAELLRHDDARGAYAGQQDIVAQLKALLVQYQRQQAAAELAARLNALADRQEANLRTTVEQSKTKGPKGRPTEDRDAMQAAQAEQKQLKADVGQAMADLKALSTQADGEPKTAAAVAKADDVAGKAATASDDLTADRPLRAAVEEQAVRDGLRDMAKQVGPDVGRAEQLQQSAERIDKAIADQKDVLAQTQTTYDKAKLAAAERHQAELADQADRAKQDAADASPAAAQQLQGAADAMRQADAALSSNRHDQAVKQQQAALAQLEQARAAVAEQAKQDAPAVADATQKDPATRADELQKQQQALADKTVVGKRDKTDPKGLAAEQSKLTEQTRDLQADVAGQNPEASKAIDAAAGQMAAAQKSLDHGHRAEAVGKQREAAGDLAKAATAMRQQAATAQKSREATEQLQGARDKISAAMVKQANAMASTAGGSKGAGDQQREAKGAVDSARDAVKDLPAPTAEKAGSAVSAAREAMEDAQRKLDQEDRAGALPSQRDALAKLAEAKGALDDQIAQATGAKPSVNASALSAVTSQLQAAGALATRAEGEAKGGQPKDAAGHLQQAMAAASKATASDQGLLGPAGRQSVQQAQADMQKATDALAKGNSDEAAKQAEAARQAMANAMMSAQIAAARGQPTTPPPAQPMPGAPGDEGEHAKPGSAASAGAMARGDVRGGGAFVGLPARDRAAVEQSQRDPVPAEYGGMVEQYYRNLADGAAK